MSVWLDVARAAAREAGALVRGQLNCAHRVQSKAAFDFVTETDALSEDLIRTRIGAAFPDHAFFCEEQISAQPEREDEILRALPEDQYTWIVDALDGTTNFIRTMPQFCISIALAHGRELILGVVYDVMRDELFEAEKGVGARCNGAAISVSSAEGMADAIVSFGFPAAARDKRETVMRAVNRLSTDVGSLRVFNCAALLLCYVACGRTDASFEYGIHIWDMAAGVILVREAGGVVTNCRGEEWSIADRDNCVGGARLHAELLKRLS